MDIHQFAVCSLQKLFLFAIMEETMQRKPRGLSVHCSVPVCVRHPLVRRRALGTGRDPAARFSFLPLVFRQLELVAVSDRSWVALIVACLGSRCCLVTCYCGRGTQGDAGGHLLLRIPPAAEKASSWVCVSRNSYLHFADIRKGLSLCL